MIEFVLTVWAWGADAPGPDHIKMMQEAQARMVRAQHREIPSKPVTRPAYGPEDLQRLDKWIKEHQHEIDASLAQGPAQK